MAAAKQEDRTTELTKIVIGVPGVRGIYPQSVIAALVAGLIRSSHSAATGLLRVEQETGRVRITARLAVDSAARAEDVIAAVHTKLLAALPNQVLDLDIEIAHID